MSRRARSASVLGAAALVVALGACSSSGSDAATTTAPSTTVAGATTTSSTPSATFATTTAAAAGTTTTAPNPPGGCTTGADAIPAAVKTKTKPVVDVDGDGKPDEAWVSSDGQGHVYAGIKTAAGGASWVPFESASPVERSEFVVNADNAGPVEIILSDGRGASLYAFVDCKVQEVLNPEGGHYAFDLGDRIGTGSGIGCVGTGAGRRLVGFNGEGSQGSTYEWSYTPIILDGLHAHNGKKVHRTFTMPQDQAKYDVTQDITCGDLTIHHDGVTLDDV